VGNLLGVTYQPWASRHCARGSRGLVTASSPTQCRGQGQWHWEWTLNHSTTVIRMAFGFWARFKSTHSSHNQALPAAPSYSCTIPRRGLWMRGSIICHAPNSPPRSSSPIAEGALFVPRPPMSPFQAARSEHGGTVNNVQLFYRRTCLTNKAARAVFAVTNNLPAGSDTMSASPRPILGKKTPIRKHTSSRHRPCSSGSQNITRQFSIFQTWRLDTGYTTSLQRSTIGSCPMDLHLQETRRRPASRFYWTARRPTNPRFYRVGRLHQSMDMKIFRMFVRVVEVCVLK